MQLLVLIVSRPQSLQFTRVIPEMQIPTKSPADSEMMSPGIPG
jgi:hypothetical protein